MLTRLLRAAVAGVLAGSFGLQPARADIYTWVDASGTVNVSNVAPPEGTRVTNVIRATAPKITARNDAAREAARRAEVQALAERVQQLENEVELARRQPPPQPEYRAGPVLPGLSYGVEMAPPPAPYAVNMAPPLSTGCGLPGMECGSWWGPGIYPASVVVLRAPHFRRFHPVRGGHHVAAHPPVRPSGGFRRR